MLCARLFSHFIPPRSSRSGAADKNTGFTQWLEIGPIASHLPRIYSTAHQNYLYGLLFRCCMVDEISWAQIQEIIFTPGACSRSLHPELKSLYNLYNYLLFLPLVCERNMAGKLLIVCAFLAIVTIATCKPRMNPLSKIFGRGKLVSLHYT